MHGRQMQEWVCGLWTDRLSKERRKRDREKEKVGRIKK